MWLLWHLLAILFVMCVVMTCWASESSDLDSWKLDVLGERNQRDYLSVGFSAYCKDSREL